MSLLAVDVETVAMDPIIAPPLVCGAFDDGVSAWLLSRNEAVDAFREALRGEIVGCNIVFDLGVFAVEEPRLLPHIFDALESDRVLSVDLQEALHDIARGTLYQDPQTGETFQRYSLVRLEQRYLGLDRSAEKANGWRLRYGELRDVPLADWPEDARAYPLADARNTLRVHLAQAQHENRQARGEEMRAAWARHLQRCWGIRTDPDRVRDLRSQITSTHNATVARFTESGFYRGPGQINPKSKTGRPYPRSQWGTKNTALIRERVTEAYGGAPPLTDSGEVSTDRDTLSESGDELLEEFAETGENEKLYNTYLRVLDRGAHRPIHPEYRLIVTGRPSASDPNVYNPPRDPRVRECFVPRAGYVFLDADYSAIEFCTLAQECFELFGVSSMREALIARKDPHLLFVSTLMGVSYASVLDLYLAGDKLIDDLRQALGKTWNYGKGGMMQPPAMVRNSRRKGVRLCVVGDGKSECRGERVTYYTPPSEPWRGWAITPTCVDCLAVADRADAAYFGTWPDMVDYFKLIDREVREGGLIRGYGFSRGGCDRRNGANFRFQHRASRGQNRALWCLAREGYTDPASPFYGARPVITPYDQCVAECPEARASDAAPRMAQVMREQMQIVCPDVPIKCEPVITRRWMKGAKPTFVDGRLTVTE